MTSTKYDVIISGGDVIDGSGTPRRRADVGLVGDRIIAIGDLSEARPTSSSTRVGGSSRRASSTCIRISTRPGVVNVNLVATFDLARQAALLMAAAGGGSIILISSTAATRGATRNAAYSASKAGLEALARLPGRGVRTGRGADQRSRARRLCDRAQRRAAREGVPEAHPPAPMGGSRRVRRRGTVLGVGRLGLRQRTRARRRWWSQYLVVTAVRAASSEEPPLWVACGRSPRAVSARDPMAVAIRNVDSCRPTIADGRCRCQCWGAG